MKKAISILIAIVLLFGMAFGVKEVMGEKNQDQQTDKMLSLDADSQKKPAKATTQAQKTKQHVTKKNAESTAKSENSTKNSDDSSTVTPESTAPKTTTNSDSSVSESAKSTTTNHKPAKAATTSQTPKPKSATNNKPTPTPKKSTPTGKYVHLTVLGYKKTLYNGKIKVTANSTAFSILKSTNLKLNYQTRPNVYVRAINGLKENDIKSGSGWKYKYNGKVYMIASDDQKVKNDDTIEWYFDVDGI